MRFGRCLDGKLSLLLGLSALSACGDPAGVRDQNGGDVAGTSSGAGVSGTGGGEVPLGGLGGAIVETPPSGVGGATGGARGSAGGAAGTSGGSAEAKGGADGIAGAESETAGTSGTAGGTGGTAGTEGGSSGTTAGTSGVGGSGGSGGVSSGNAGSAGVGGGTSSASKVPCAPVPTSADAELVSNGTFDTGSSDWFAFAGGMLSTIQTTACAGRAAAVTNRTETSHGPAQSLLGKVASGDIVGIGAWVRINGASSAKVMATLKVATGANSDYHQLASVTATREGWTFLSGSVKPVWTGSATEISLYFEGPPAGVDIYLDNVYGMRRGPIGGSGTGNGDGSVSVTVAPETKYQTLEGFGASIAWFVDALTGHAKANELYPLLFEDLGLDILRLRNRYQRTNEAVNLADEKAILDAATASLGRPPKVLLTSWSPPASLKANADDDCDQEDKDAGTCTLRKVGGKFDYAGFADYWEDSLSSYASAGISPTWISIQNEPDFEPTSWEGCRFDPTENATFPGIDAALEAVSARLASSPSAPGILGPEVLGIHYGKLQAYLAALDHKKLAGVAHHIYEQGNDGIWDWSSPGPDSFVDEMFGVGLAAGSKPSFQTEFNTDEDTSGTGGFETAWLIHNSLAEQGASAFLYWELIWSNTPTAKGLVYLDDSSTYTIRQQYYAVRHYSFFTDPGYVRVGAASNLPGIRSTAFRSPDGERLVVVALNVGDTEKLLQIDTGTFVPSTSAAVRSVFSGGEEYWTATALGPENSLSLPTRSVVTAVFEK